MRRDAFVTDLWIFVRVSRATELKESALRLLCAFPDELVSMIRYSWHQPADFYENLTVFEAELVFTQMSFKPPKEYENIEFLLDICQLGLNTSLVSKSLAKELMVELVIQDRFLFDLVNKNKFLEPVNGVFTEAQLTTMNKLSDLAYHFDIKVVWALARSVVGGGKDAPALKMMHSIILDKLWKDSLFAIELEQSIQNAPDKERYGLMLLLTEFNAISDPYRTSILMTAYRLKQKTKSTWLVEAKVKQAAEQFLTSFLNAGQIQNIGFYLDTAEQILDLFPALRFKMIETFLTHYLKQSKLQ